jgi:rare lipoprotein A
MEKKFLSISLLLTLLLTSLLGFFDPAAAKSSSRQTYKQAKYGNLYKYRSSSSRRYRLKRRSKKYARYRRAGNTGIASWYGSGRTASGRSYGSNTAAHRYLPFGTRVKVTNLRNGRSTWVVINDRGPFIGGRIIDLSRGAAQQIGMAGIDQVKITY